MAVLKLTELLITSASRLSTSVYPIMSPSFSTSFRASDSCPLMMASTSVVCAVGESVGVYGRVRPGRLRAFYSLDGHTNSSVPLDYVRPSRYPFRALLGLVSHANSTLHD